MEEFQGDGIYEASRELEANAGIFFRTIERLTGDWLRRLVKLQTDEEGEKFREPRCQTQVFRKSPGWSLSAPAKPLTEVKDSILFANFLSSGWEVSIPFKKFVDFSIFSFVGSSHQHV